MTKWARESHALCPRLPTTEQSSGRLSAWQRHTGVANSSTREPAIQMPPHPTPLSPPRSSNTGSEHDTGEATLSAGHPRTAFGNSIHLAIPVAVQSNQVVEYTRQPRISSPSPEDIYRVNHLAYMDGPPSFIDSPGHFFATQVSIPRASTTTSALLITCIRRRVDK